MTNSDGGRFNAELTALRSFPGVVWTTDRDFRITTAFGALFDRAGVTVEHVVGRTIPEWFGADDPDQTWIRAHARALAGERVDFTAVGLGVDLRVLVEPLQEDGQIVGLVGIATENIGTDPAATFARRIGQQEALARLSLEAIRLRDLDQLFGLATTVLRTNLTANGAAVAEALPDGTTLRIKSLNTDGPDEWPALLTRRGTLATLALDADDAVLVGDFAADSRIAGLDHPFASGVSVPIRQHTGNFGALTVVSRELHAFSEPDVHFINSVANVLSGAIERAEAVALASAAFEAVPNGLLIVDSAGVIVDMNAAAERLAGRRRAEIIGADQTIFSRDPSGSAARLRRLDSGEEVETDVGRPDGSIRRVIASAVPNFRPSLTLFVARDVTDQRRLEHELQQAQKMQVVGELAAGIAHDFNNLLIAVRGLSSVVLDELEPGSPHQADITAIHEAGVRGIAVVDRLLTFARPPETAEVHVTRVAQVVDEMRPLLRQLLRSEIELLLESPTSADVLVDPRDLEQVVLNLVVNAQDAIYGRGTISIRVTDRVLSDEDAARVGVVPDHYVFVAVSDDGSGMDGATLAQARELFFTTKPRGRGSGLGLALASRVARVSGGTLTIESTLGNGSTVTLLLPKVDVDAESSSSDLPNASETAPRGVETILVVDDDPLVLRFADRALHRLGYSVIATTSPDEALAATRDRPEIAAAILDIVMAPTGGQELAEMLWRARPRLAISFMSADTDSSAFPVLHKPFTEAELARTVRAMLDASA